MQRQWEGRPRRAKVDTSDPDWWRTAVTRSTPSDPEHRGSPASQAAQSLLFRCPVCGGWRLPAAPHTCVQGRLA